MRTEQINASLESTLTRDRLTKYLDETDGGLDEALRLYERNMRLSEAFYTPLQCMEICLRNTIHATMTDAYGEDWLTNGAAPLGGREQNLIDEAIRELGGGVVPPPIGSVVAELRFAFWISLLAKGYDSSLWRKALFKGFKARAGLSRKTVHGRFNMLRRFRNRVAHHEPIFHNNLEVLHSEIIEAIGWMSADTAAWTEHHSRVLDVTRHV